MVFNEFAGFLLNRYALTSSHAALNPAPVRISIYFASPPNQHFLPGFNILVMVNEQEPPHQ